MVRYPLASGDTTQEPSSRHTDRFGWTRPNPKQRKVHQFNVVPLRLAWTIAAGEALSLLQSRTLSLGSLLELSFAHCTKANFPTVKNFQMSHRLSKAIIVWIMLLFTATLILCTSSKALVTLVKRPTTAASRARDSSLIRWGTSTTKQKYTVAWIRSPCSQQLLLKTASSHRN